jgi:hypothetical protein
MAEQGMKEPLLSGYGYDIAADFVHWTDPSKAQALSARAIKADPRRAQLPPELRAEFF